jgi:L-2,4-diaminobutyrate decarboxylase
VWDGHKLLYMPATVSAVLFRRAQDSYAAFAQDASYLFQDNTHEAQAFNTSYRTLECTKRMMGLKLWAAFSLYGTQGLGVLVDHAFANARDMAQQIAAHAEFELLMPPATNIVCFRHRPANIEGAALSQHQTRLRLSLVESGAFHLTQVQLDGAIWLRCTLMNPYTEASHIASLLQALAQAALAAS